MDLPGFALAVLLIELTPGPNMAWLAGLAATEGRRSGSAAVAGVALGLLVNGLFAALGLAILLEAVPMLRNGLRMAGAAMMLWLAFEAWQSASGKAPRTDRQQTLRRAFATGAMINLLNPKAYLFFVFIVPRFLDGEDLTVSNALTLAAISAAVATIVHISIVAAASRARTYLSQPRHMMIVRRIFALIMLAVAASFLVSDFG